MRPTIVRKVPRPDANVVQHPMEVVRIIPARVAIFDRTAELDESARGGLRKLADLVVDRRIPEVGAEDQHSMMGTDRLADGDAALRPMPEPLVKDAVEAAPTRSAIRRATRKRRRLSSAA